MGKTRIWINLTAVAAWAVLRPTASHVVAGGPVYETSIVLADSTPLAYVGSSPLGVGTPAFAVSPDGMTLVFVGQSGATTRLYQRRLDASAVAVLPGTDGAYGPFFSPDGQSVGFFSGGTVKRTNLQSGATVSLAELVLPYGGVWLADGRILIAAQEGDQLVAVPDLRPFCQRCFAEAESYTGDALAPYAAACSGARWRYEAELGQPPEIDAAASVSSPPIGPFQHAGGHRFLVSERAPGEQVPSPSPRRAWLPEAPAAAPPAARGLVQLRRPRRSALTPDVTPPSQVRD